MPENPIFPAGWTLYGDVNNDGSFYLERTGCNVSYGIELGRLMNVVDWAENLDYALQCNRFANVRLSSGHSTYYLQRCYRVYVQPNDSFSQSEDDISDWMLGRMCDRCDNLCSSPDAQWCDSCYSEVITCDNCRTELHDNDSFYVERRNIQVCEDCYHDTLDEDEYDDDEEEQEDFDNSPDVNPYPVHSMGELSFTPREFDTTRREATVSVEMEFARRPEPVARELYRLGLSSVDGVAGYHSQRNQGGTAYVEYDGSVDGGGELVMAMHNWHHEGETERLWRTLDVLRQKVRNGDNSLDSRCGCHIHVDSSRLSLDSVVSSVIVYGYLEDILYKIAASNYSRHRSMGENSYCNTTPKRYDKDRFATTFGDRYYGMNVSNYIRARYNCGCGAGFNDADFCGCSAAMATVEFRLWNTTCNPIKLHAYIALSEAIMAYGENRDLDASEFPAMSFNHSTQPALTGDELVERVQWMLRELPLSESERDSIRYCIRHSSLGGYVNAVDVSEDSLQVQPYVAIPRDEQRFEQREQRMAEAREAARIAQEEADAAAARLEALRNRPSWEGSYDELGDAISPDYYHMAYLTDETTRVPMVRSGHTVFVPQSTTPFPEWAIRQYVCHERWEDNRGDYVTTHIFFDRNLRLRDAHGSFVSDPVVARIDNANRYTLGHRRDLRLWRDEQYRQAWDMVHSTPTADVIDWATTISDTIRDRSFVPAAPIYNTPTYTYSVNNTF